MPAARITLSLTSEVDSDLESLAFSLGKSKSDVVRTGISALIHLLPQAKRDAFNRARGARANHAA